MSAPLLDVAGVRSWKAFATNTLSVESELNDRIITFVPMENLGPKDGFVEITAANRTVAEESEAQIGAGLRDAFAQAK